MQFCMVLLERRYMPIAKNLPKRAKEIWEEVYQKNKEEFGEERAAKIAWGAVKKGWKKIDDKWVRKKASEIKRPPSFRGQFSEVSLDHGEKISTIQLMKVGKWDHPIYGMIEVTQEQLERFVRNFNDEVRKAIPIDVEHKIDEGAVGWFKEIYHDNEVLYGVVEWTAEGINLIQSKKYRFFSAEVADVWEDPATGNEYRDVITGGALTNRPFFQELDEIILSEKIVTKKFTNKTVKKKGGGKVKMTKEEIIKKLSENPDYKLPEKASEETKKLFAEVKAELKKAIDDGKKKSKVDTKKFNLIKSFAKLGIESYTDLKNLVDEVKEARKDRIRAEIKEYVLPKALDEAVNFAFSLKPKAYKEYVGVLKKQSVVKLFTELGHSEIVKPTEGAKTPKGVSKESHVQDQKARKYMSEHPEEFKKMSEPEAYRQALYKVEKLDKK